LIESGEKDLLDAAQADLLEDTSLIESWLQSTEKPANKSKDFQAILDEALKINDFVKAKELVDQVILRAMGNTARKRESLEKFLRTSGVINASDAQAQLNFLGSPFTPKALYDFPPRPIQQHYAAFCVFDIMQTLSQLANFGLDITDAVDTCPGAGVMPTSDVVCAANIGTAVTSIAYVASALSLAADQCAATIIPNIQAECSGSVAGIVGLLAQISAGAALTGAACNAFGIFPRVPPNVDASTIGRVPPGGVHWKPPVSFPEFSEDVYHNISMHWLGRRLLLGGGKKSSAGHCGVDITEVAWWLASFGLLLNEATNPKVFKNCPARGLGAVHEYTAGYCAIDVAGAIFTFGQAGAFIQLAFIHCTRKLDVPALCGSGIDFLVSATAGLVAAFEGFHLSCKQYAPYQTLFNYARHFDDFTGGSITESAGSAFETFGRRLEEMRSFERYVERTKSRFATPRAAWTHLGFESTPRGADWRVSARQRLRDVITFVDFPAHRE